VIAWLSPCQDAGIDVRAKCKPRLVRNVLSEAEAQVFIRAGETAAQNQGGWDTTRHAKVPTRDLGLGIVLQEDLLENRFLTGIIKRALHTTIYPELATKCGAKIDELIVADSFMIRYDAPASGVQEDGKPPQPGLERHKDGHRYSATIVLSRGELYGVAWPTEHDRTELGTNKTFDEELNFDRFVCESSCSGQSCDAWVNSSHHTCSTLEDAWGCDCGLCRECLPLLQKVPGALPFHFGGGGTRFPTGRNATFHPSIGEALVHGGRITHAADPITSGRRYILAFFFDEAACETMDVVERYSLLAANSIIVALHCLRGMVLRVASQALSVILLSGGIAVAGLMSLALAFVVHRLLIPQGAKVVPGK